MIKKFVLSILLLLSLLPLFPAVTVTDGTGEGGEYKEAFQKILGDELSILWKNEEIEVKIVSIVSPFEGVDILTLALMGREYEIAVNKSNVNASIKSAAQEVLLYALEGEGETLDYIYLSSYSSLSLPKARKGTVYFLMSPEGKILADLSLLRQEEGVSELEPLYVKRAYAGLELEKSLSIQIRADVGLIFSPSLKASGRINVKKTNWLYPFNPSIGFTYINDYYGVNSYFGMLGIEYVLPFASLFTNRFTLIQDGGLIANASVLLGYDDGFALGCDIFVAYQHFVSPHFSWNLGVSYSYVVSKALSWSPSVDQLALQAGMGALF